MCSSREDRRGEVWKRSGANVVACCAVNVKSAGDAVGVLLFGDGVNVEVVRECVVGCVGCWDDCLMSLLREGSCCDGGRRECRAK